MMDGILLAALCLGLFLGLLYGILGAVTPGDLGKTWALFSISSFLFSIVILLLQIVVILLKMVGDL